VIVQKGIGKEQLEELENRIGHQFSAQESLHKALTHASAIRRNVDNYQYERLEFLGDRVLGLVVSELLFETFPEAKEGELSLRLNSLVSGKTCAEVADEIMLHEFIRTGTDLKHLTSKRMQGVRADVVEAMIAAVYLDGGLEAAARVVKKLWQKRLFLADAARRDSKTALQEWAHAKKLETPTYHLVDQDGPDHDPVFTVKVELSNKDSAKGKGRSKRSAEQQAARKILEREGVWKIEDEQN
jgi:ribonuclease-3